MSHLDIVTNSGSCTIRLHLGTLTLTGLVVLRETGSDKFRISMDAGNSLKFRISMDAGNSLKFQADLVEVFCEQ